MIDRPPRADLRQQLAPLLQFLESPNFPWLAIAFSMLLALPALFGGIHGEAHLQHLVAGESAALGEARPVWDLYDWLPADDAGRTRFADQTGVWSWSRDAGWGAFRPLTSLTHAVELRFWPEQAWLMHLHDLLWRGLLVFCAALLLQRFLGTSWIAALAMLFVALDDLGAAAATATTERGDLMAACFTLLALLVHDLWLRDGRQAGRWTSPVLLLLALASSEAGYAGAALLVAHTLCLGEGSQRWTRLALPALVTLSWSGAYFAIAGIDAIHLPMDTLAGLVIRLPIEALAQLGVPGVERLALDGWAMAAAALGGGAGTLALAALLWPLFRANHTAAFWGVVWFASLLPLAASPVAGGARIVTAVAGAALLAQFTAALLHTARDGRLASLRPGVVAACGVLLVLHVPVALVAAPWRAMGGIWAESEAEAADGGIPSDAVLPEQQLVIVRAPDLERGPFLLLRRAASGGTLPASARVLAWGVDDVAVERTADDTVVLSLPRPLQRPTGEALLGKPTATHPDLGRGEDVEIEGFAAKVLDPDAEGRTRIEFRFDVPCDNASLRWITWNGSAYEPFTVPAPR